jgi:hypothetical protein
MMASDDNFIHVMRTRTPWEIKRALKALSTIEVCEFRMSLWDKAIALDPDSGTYLELKRLSRLCTEFLVERKNNEHSHN